MKLHEFVRVARVSTWAKIAVQISNDEAPMPLLTVGFLIIFMHVSCVHFATLKIHSVSQTPTKLWTKDITGSSAQSQRWVLQESCSCLCKLGCKYGACGYQAVWGCAVRKKSGWWWAVWGKVGKLCVCGGVCTCVCVCARIQTYKLLLFSVKKWHKSTA